MSDELGPVVVHEAKESGGDLVIRMKRVGATPFLRFTPYQNGRGVRVHMWSCISITGKAMPDRTLLFHPRIVDPSQHDDYPLRMFTTEWVRQQVSRMREAKVDLVPAEKTPFAGDMMRWDDGC